MTALSKQSKKKNAKFNLNKRTLRFDFLIRKLASVFVVRASARLERDAPENPAIVTSKRAEARTTNTDANFRIRKSKRSSPFGENKSQQPRQLSLQRAEARTTNTDANLRIRKSKRNVRLQNVVALF